MYKVVLVDGGVLHVGIGSRQMLLMAQLLRFVRVLLLSGWGYRQHCYCNGEGDLLTSCSSMKVNCELGKKKKMSINWIVDFDQIEEGILYVF
jgi:hypothetical protein